MSVLLVDAPLKFSFGYGVQLRHFISFKTFHILKCLEMSFQETRKSYMELGLVSREGACIILCFAKKYFVGTDLSRQKPR